MRSLVSIAAAVAVGLTLGACGGSADEKAAEPRAAPPTAPGVAPEREPAPKLAGESLTGEPVALADFRGRPVLVNVWSSW